MTVNCLASYKVDAPFLSYHISILCSFVLLFLFMITIFHFRNYFRYARVNWRTATPLFFFFFGQKKSFRREIFFMEDPPIESTWNRKRSFDDAINASLPGCRFCLVTQRSSLFGEVRCVTRRKRLRGRQGRHRIDFRSKRGTFFLPSFLKIHFFCK